MTETPRVTNYPLEPGKAFSVNTQVPVNVEIRTKSGDTFKFVVAGQTVFEATAGELETDIETLTINIPESSSPKGPRLVDDDP